MRYDLNHVSIIMLIRNISLLSLAVFRGIWNGTDVAIKVFLEQDLTAENMEDFCNEISILRYVAIHMLSFSNSVFYINIF